MGIGEGEKGSLHKVALVARRRVSRRHDERIESAALARAIRPGGFMIVVPQHPELVPFFGCQAMWGKDCAGLLVPRACADIVIVRHLPAVAAAVVHEIGRIGQDAAIRSLARLPGRQIAREQFERKIARERKAQKKHPADGDA